MKDTILDKYFCLIDGYSYKFSKLRYDFEEDFELEPDDVTVLRHDRPIEIPILMKYLSFIIKQMYVDLGSKKKVKEAVEKISSE